MNIMKHYYNFQFNIFSHAIYFCNGEAEFLEFLPSSVLRDPLEIIILKCWFAAQEAFLIIGNVENNWI